MTEQERRGDRPDLIEAHTQGSDDAERDAEAIKRTAPAIWQDELKTMADEALNHLSVLPAREEVLVEYWSAYFEMLTFLGAEYTTGVERAKQVAVYIEQIREEELDYREYVS